MGVPVPVACRMAPVPASASPVSSSSVEAPEQEVADETRVGSVAGTRVLGFSSKALVYGKPTG